EQKIPHVAYDMPALATDRHGVAAAAGQRVAQGRRRVERLTSLVECHLREVGAEPHLARVRRQHPREQVEQGGLAGAVWADDADPVAARDASREVAHDRALAVRFADPLRRGNKPPRELRLRCRHSRRSWGAAPFAMLLPQRMELAEPPLIAGAARGHPVAQPVFLHGDLAPELVVLGFLLLQRDVARGFERPEAIVERARPPAVEPYRPARQTLQ